MQKEESSLILRILMRKLKNVAVVCMNNIILCLVYYNPTPLEAGTVAFSRLYDINILLHKYRLFIIKENL